MGLTVRESFKLYTRIIIPAADGKEVPSLNTYSIDGMYVGIEESFTRIITAEMMEMFSEICGDINPLHCSEAYAKGKGYDNRVVFGMLTASLYSTLVGVYLPGQNCLLRSVETKFISPVYIGEKLIVTGRVTEIHEQYGVITVKAEIRKYPDNTKVSSAIIQVGM
jgi:3-hydroxybutyryl-CoA dehydratase